MLLGWCLIYVASTYGVSSSHYLTFSVTLFAMTKTSGAMHVAKITNRRVDKSGQPREYVSHLLRRTYRDVAAVHAQAKALGLPALLGPAGRERDIALAVIIARVCRPGSKLATTRWWADTTRATTRW